MSQFTAKIPSNFQLGLEDLGSTHVVCSAVGARLKTRADPLPGLSCSLLPLLPLPPNYQATSNDQTTIRLLAEKKNFRGRGG